MIESFILCDIFVIQELLGHVAVLCRANIYLGNASITHFVIIPALPNDRVSTQFSNGENTIPRKYYPAKNTHEYTRRTIDTMTLAER